MLSERGDVACLGYQGNQSGAPPASQTTARPATRAATFAGVFTKRRTTPPKVRQAIPVFKE
jgi:hypothetical protein